MTEHIREHLAQTEAALTHEAKMNNIYSNGFQYIKGKIDGLRLALAVLDKEV